MRAAARRLRLLPAAPRHLHGWPLPWGGQRPAVFHRVRSLCDRAADRKPRAVCFGIRFTCTTIQYSALRSARARYRFVNGEARKPTTNLNQMRGSSPCVLHEPLLIRIENLQWRGQWRLDTLLPAGKDFDVPLLRILPGCQRPARRTIPTGKLWPKLRGADRVGLDRDRLDATTVCVM
jgi:hypothetical protein